MKNSIIIIILIAAVAIQGCYTSKPTGKATPPDYNKRVNVSNAGMKKKGTGINVVVTVSLAGVGAFAGYEFLPLAQTQTATGKEPVKAVNAAIGGLSGAAISYLIDAAAGKNKTKPISDPMIWINKANPDYRLLSGTGQHFTIIHSSVERNYTVKTIQDVRDFKEMFPNSGYSENVVTQGISILPRSDLPSLLDIYPNTSQSNAVKSKYLSLSTSISQCIEAAKKYYEVKNDAEIKALGMVSDVGEVETFSSYFSKEANYDILFKKCVDAKKSSDSEIIACFPNHQEAIRLMANILSRINSASEICDFVRKYSNYNRNEVAQALASRKIIKTKNDFQTIASCMSQQCDIFIIAALNKSDAPAYEYPAIMTMFPSMSSSAKSEIFAMYTNDKRREYNEAVTARSLNRMKNFIDRYKINSPEDDTSDLNAQAELLHEYWNVLEKKSTELYAEYAKKYPVKFDEMDDLAYRNVSVTSTSSINLYVRHFPSGKYVSIVMAQIPAAQANEQRAEQERMNELCNSCGGNGLCIFCNGHRQVTCSRCNGSGTIKVGWDDEIARCTNCNGSGRNTCHNCRNGRCSSCNGSGYKNR